MAFIVFIIVKVMNKILVKKEEVKEESKVEVKPKDIELLEEIRDLLKESKSNK